MCEHTKTDRKKRKKGRQAGRKIRQRNIQDFENARAKTIYRLSSGVVCIIKFVRTYLGLKNQILDWAGLL